jgi:hypothetical protein
VLRDFDSSYVGSGSNPVMRRCPLHDRSPPESGSRFAI